ncbi:MAG TPA: GNAT family N-acetyltransferase [Thermomicrobiales bacterium]|nr:GNAT family N-acetyltransferase [Thermomicrobiales bacterium]
MNVQFEPVPIEDIRQEIGAHIAALPGPVDSFYEDHVLLSNHARIVIGGQYAGHAAIHDESLITFFSLKPGFLAYGEAVFNALRRREQVTSTYIPTCDEFFLVHALDDYRKLTPQARLFRHDHARMPMMVPDNLTLRPASHSDAELLGEASSFFDRIDQRIEAGELFVLERDGERAGFGIREMSRLVPGRASIGMFTREEQRQQGVGSAIVALLIQRCREEGVEPVSGCWYYNHRSRRALERAGMNSTTRLLKFEF